MQAVTVGDVVGRYVVEGVLGAGATASVYKVRHQDLGSVHALKVLTVASRSMRERMVREGRAQAGLAHPNVVEVTDIVDVGASLGLVMPFVSGPTLEGLLQRGPLDHDRLDQLAVGIVRGVRAAHRAGLVHRDLKPANILVQPTESGLVPRVSDFGIAKVLGGDGSVSATRTGQTLGTPRYMAPEQVRDASTVDRRADIWAIGAILFELCTGRPAFLEADAFEVQHAVVRGAYPSPETLRPDLPDRMVRAIRGALTVDAEARLQDCDTLLSVWTGAPVAEDEPVWAPAGPADSLAASATLSIPPAGDDTVVPTPAAMAVPEDLGDLSFLFGDPAGSGRSLTGPGREPEEPEPRRWLPILALLVALPVVGLGLVGTSLFLLGYLKSSEAVIVEDPGEVPVEPAVGDPADVAAPEPAPAAPARPRPAPAAPTVAKLDVRGDAIGVAFALDTTGEVYGEGELPPGAYTARMSSGGRSVAVDHVFRFEAGHRYTVYCSDRKKTCELVSDEAF